MDDQQENSKQLQVAKEVIRRLRIQNKKLLEQVAVLKSRASQTKNEKAIIQKRLAALIKLNDSLSGALGSCRKCWGEDDGCPECSGNGSPGWRNINKRLFNIYVLPVIDKLHS